MLRSITMKTGSHCHGYWKASGGMMAAALHSNVGLMHATMGIFDAWCDRAPILILGATGPWDAMKRRPWIDWLHTASDQGALIRDYTKWDNQPGSVGAAMESILRGSQIAQLPAGTVYTTSTSPMQEEKIGPRGAPDAHAMRARWGRLIRRSSGAARLLSGGRIHSCSPAAARAASKAEARVALAETLNLRVLTNGNSSGRSRPTIACTSVRPPTG